MSKLQAILQGQVPPGVYRFPSRALLATLQAEAEEAGWRLFYLDGSNIYDKAGLLDAAKPAFAMPGYVGNNWDAFEEAINDLAWAPAAGYAVLFDDAGNLDDGDPAAMATLMDILATAADNWSHEGRPFFGLLRGAGRSEAALLHWPEVAS
jgi:hypothetical protein